MGMSWSRVLQLVDSAAFFRRTGRKRRTSSTLRPDKEDRTAVKKRPAGDQPEDLQNSNHRHDRRQMKSYTGNSALDHRAPFSKDSPDAKRRRAEGKRPTRSDVVDAMQGEPELLDIYMGLGGPRPYDPAEDGRFFDYLAWRCRKDLDLMEEVALKAPRIGAKWKEEHEGTTWLRYELRKAAESAEEVWEPPREIPSSDDAKGDHTSSSWPIGTALTGRVKLGERIGGVIKPPEQLVEGVLYAGKIHALNSEPGESKTTAALWAVLEVVRQGRPVLYLDAGLTLRAEDGYVVATPKGRLTPELRDEIACHKAELLEALRWDEAAAIALLRAAAVYLNGPLQIALEHLEETDRRAVYSDLPEDHLVEAFEARDMFWYRISVRLWVQKAKATLREAERARGLALPAVSSPTPPLVKGAS